MGKERGKSRILQRMGPLVGLSLIVVSYRLSVQTF